MGADEYFECGVCSCEISKETGCFAQCFLRGGQTTKCPACGEMYYLDVSPLSQLVDICVIHTLMAILLVFAFFSIAWSDFLSGLSSMLAAVSVLMLRGYLYRFTKWTRLP